MYINFRVVVALFFGLLSLSCSPEATKAYRPEVFEKVTTNQVVVDPRLDILFVVDNSGSMMPHQDNLATNVAKFTSELTKSSFIEYNIGVITTDGGYGNDCCGKLVGNPRVVHKKTPNLNTVLARNFRVGTDGSANEMVFDLVKLALTNPNLSNWNAGFYRPDATLALMFITDAEDQSDKLDDRSFYQFLLSLKGGKASKVLAYGAIVPSNDTMNCSRDDGYTKPVRIERFLEALPNNKNNVINLCDPDYGTRLANLAKSIVDEVSTIRLTQVPYVPSIKVKWGSIELPADIEKGWAFDSKQNAIILGKGIDWTAQPSGTQLAISYDVGMFK